MTKVSFRSSGRDAVRCERLLPNLLRFRHPLREWRLAARRIGILAAVPERLGNLE